MTNPMDDLLTDGQMDSTKIRTAAAAWALHLWAKADAAERDKGAAYFFGAALPLVCERAESMFHNARMMRGEPDFWQCVNVIPFGRKRPFHDLRSQF